MAEGASAGRTTLLLLAGCIPLLLLGGCLAPVVLVLGMVGSVGGTDDQDDSCPSGPAVIADESGLPEESVGDGEWHDEQLLNAAIILNVAAGMDLSVHDQTIGVMTAMGESSLMVIDTGDAAGPDSRGLFQQRDSWGSYEERMDPVRSSELFFEVLAEVEDRADREPTLAAHEVQANADPYHYEHYWDDAVEVVAALAEAEVDLDSVESGCGGGRDPVISEDCEPVAEGIHPSACRAYSALVAEFGTFWHPLGGVGCQDPRDGRGDHPVGQACDYMMAAPRSTPTDGMRAEGDRVVQWIIDNHTALDVKYVIWNGYIWNPDNEETGAWEDVRRSHGNGRNSAGEIIDITQAHVDHIHLSTGPWHGSDGR